MLEKVVLLEIVIKVVGSSLNVDNRSRHYNLSTTLNWSKSSSYYFKSLHE